MLTGNGCPLLSHFLYCFHELKNHKKLPKLTQGPLPHRYRSFVKLRFYSVLPNANLYGELLLLLIILVLRMLQLSMAQLWSHFYAKPTPIHFCHCPTYLHQCCRCYLYCLSFSSTPLSLPLQPDLRMHGPLLQACAAAAFLSVSLWWTQLHLANPHPLQLLQVIDCLSSFGMFFHSSSRIRHTGL